MLPRGSSLGKWLWSGERLPLYEAQGEGMLKVWSLYKILNFIATPAAAPFVVELFSPQTQYSQQPTARPTHHNSKWWWQSMTGVSLMGSRGSPPASGSTTPTMTVETAMIMTLPSSSLPHRSASLTMWCPLVSPPPPPTMMMLLPKSQAGEHFHQGAHSPVFFRRYDYDTCSF